MKTFDLANSPFTGTNLIEASAGTGKTYTILTQEIADDFWRKHLYTMPPEFISYTLKKISGPDFF